MASMTTRFSCTALPALSARPALPALPAEEEQPYLLYPSRGGGVLSLPLHWAHAPHEDYNMQVGCSMERGRHSGTAEGRRVRNRPCDVARRSEVCGTLEDLTVRVWRRLGRYAVGARGALGPSWGRAWQHREVPSPVRAYPCLCRRTTGVRSMHRRRRGCSKGAVRVQGRPDGDPVLGVGIRCSVCACDVWTLSYGDVGTCGRCLRAPRAPPSTGAGVRRLCGGSSGARGARCCVRRSAARSDGVTDAERLRL